jgi:Putative prokaryotic signal transducing protein
VKDGFVKIEVFSDPILANLAKTKLESEGIETFIANENTIRMDFLISQALGGVQLWVPEEDRERALIALNGEAAAIRLVTEPPPAAPVASVVCPKCGSENTSKRRSLSKSAVVSFLLGLPLPFFRRQSHCFECGHSWT